METTAELPEIKFNETRQGKTGKYTFKNVDKCACCGQRIIVVANENNGMTVFHEKFWLRLSVVEAN